MSRVARVAILDCELLISELAEICGQYFSNLFTPLLQAAALRAEDLTIEVQGWDVTKGLFPDPTTIDAVLITGAVAGAYDTDPWIETLGQYISNVYLNYPNVKILGTCFGHQLVGHVLLRQYGVVAEPNPVGRQIGIRSVLLDPAFSTHFNGTVRGLDALRIQVVHGDHVKVPETGLPDGWYSVGGTECCSTHGLFLPGRVFTMQGHVEFTSDLTKKIVECFFTEDKGYTKEWLGAAIERVGVGKNDDSEVIADMLLQFLMS